MIFNSGKTVRNKMSEYDLKFIKTAIGFILMVLLVAAFNYLLT